MNSMYVEVPFGSKMLQFLISGYDYSYYIDHALHFCINCANCQEDNSDKHYNIFTRGGSAFTVLPNVGSVYYGFSSSEGTISAEKAFAHTNATLSHHYPPSYWNTVRFGVTYFVYEDPIGYYMVDVDDESEDKAFFGRLMCEITQSKRRPVFGIFDWLGDEFRGEPGFCEDNDCRPLRIDVYIDESDTNFIVRTENNTYDYYYE
ncbi:MAG: hypothetical protein KatS3mg087_0483 [Patescibacteria group bacterium]|nr:MAG: hypothetical protein KatS3mg087_0483 [Patescibacteria group bacterium]